MELHVLIKIRLASIIGIWAVNIYLLLSLLGCCSALLRLDSCYCGVLAVVDTIGNIILDCELG